MDSQLWHKILNEIEGGDIEVMVDASARLAAEAGDSDIPKLTELLSHKDFVVREAAAWALSGIGAVDALPQLFTAYERGFDEGHDNDGFSTALVELAQLFPEKTKVELTNLQYSSDPAIRAGAEWLLEFC